MDTKITISTSIFTAQPYLSDTFRDNSFHTIHLQDQMIYLEFKEEALLDNRKNLNNTYQAVNSIASQMTTSMLCLTVSAGA